MTAGSNHDHAQANRVYGNILPNYLTYASSHYQQFFTIMCFFYIHLTRYDGIEFDICFQLFLIQSVFNRNTIESNLHYEQNSIID